jgi:hypothetical protein
MISKVVPPVHAVQVNLSHTPSDKKSQMKPSG